MWCSLAGFRLSLIGCMVRPEINEPACFISAGITTSAMHNAVITFCTAESAIEIDY